MQIMSTKEVSDYLNINEKKIYQLVKENEIPYTRVGGKIIFVREIIDRWIYKNTEMAGCLLISGSDDLLFREIIDHYNSDADHPAFFASVGSINALKILKQSRSHMSCVHIADQSGKHNESYLDRYLNRSDYVVIRLFSRRQGLVVKAENPHKIKSIKDIVARKLRFANRNKGSGTRLLIDQMLYESSVSLSDDSICSPDSTSHIGAAMKVLRGEAEATVAVQHVAELLGLTFIPLVEEPFDLVVPVDQWESRPARDFIKMLDQANLPGHLQNLSGYDISSMGNVFWKPGD